MNYVCFDTLTQCSASQPQLGAINIHLVYCDLSFCGGGGGAEACLRSSNNLVPTWGMMSALTGQRTANSPTSSPERSKFTLIPSSVSVCALLNSCGRRVVFTRWIHRSETAEIRREGQSKCNTVKFTTLETQGVAESMQDAQGTERQIG